MSDFPLLDRLPTPDACNADSLLDAFLDYLSHKNLCLYPAQEEAILALFSGLNVILNTPTGSGKSLVATAMHFQSLALGRRSVYTSPIKALVNEKFLALCREFGPDSVGMATGDSSVNRHAPILCCTAEVLANYALRDGELTPFTDVIMDEFHYYSDRDRGVAWQIPLLTLKKSKFLLMSATLGDTSFFQSELTRLTQTDTVLISGNARPVPLEYSYVETSIDETVTDLLKHQKAPIYLVHFTQNDVAKSAQDLMSVNFCSSEEKNQIAEALREVKFSSPYGNEVKRFLRHGIGIHHAGLLPKYRVLVETLAQRGLLKIICGTDTLGVGVNIPIRTVLLTKLSKYDGQKIKILTARDFHQIAGRAGRKGFDDIGFVVAQAPEHVIENAKLEAKALGDPKKGKKLVRKKPPEGFVGWNHDTFTKLQSAQPEALQSRFDVSHGMLLQVFNRPGDSCAALREIIRTCHDSPLKKIKHQKRAWQLFRSLLDRSIVSILPKEHRPADGSKIQVHVELQEDFSLNHELSLYLIDTLALLDTTAPDYPLNVLSLCEAIVENPEIILRKQLDAQKNEAMAAMKRDGIEYNERLNRLDQIEYPKPLKPLIDASFLEFTRQHPWIGDESIKPKSIVREMYENFFSFSGYIRHYDLQRAEGVLLRHLSTTYKVLAQTVPEPFKTEPILELETWLTGVLHGTDSSLLDEWQKLKNPNWTPPSPTDPDTSDITQNPREFTALIRAEIFHFLRAIERQHYQTAADLLNTPQWSADALADAFDPYYEEKDSIRLDNEARNGRHTYLNPNHKPNAWLVHQVIVDPNDENDWQASFEIDLLLARESGKPNLQFLQIAPVSAPEPHSTT